MLIRIEIVQNNTANLDIVHTVNDPSSIDQ